MKKIASLLILLSCVHVTFGQSMLDRQVTFSVSEVPIEDALFKLIDDYDINLSFSNNIIPKNKLVTVSASGASVRSVLNRILSGTALSFREVGSQIVIYRKEPVVQKKYTISGYVLDSETNERVIGAAVYDSGLKSGTYTNDYGYFSLTLPEGDIELYISYLGYQADSVGFYLSSNRQMNVFLKPAFLIQVVVNSVTDSTLLETTLSGISINMEQASRLNSLGGETDIMRLAYSLPGILTGADGFGGISVRGGNVDQNLFLLDGVPVYNATHGLGVFSVYNSSSVRSAQILKGAFPAHYGGRISSVWDVQTKEGNSRQTQGEIDVGLSSGKLTLEGPVSNGKGSYFFSGRRAFFDFFSEPITRKLRKNKGIDGFIRYYFYDGNMKVNYKLGKRDRVYLSYYRGRDNFRDQQEQVQTYFDSLAFLIDEEVVYWGNDVTALRWNHVYSDRLFGNTLFTFSQYIYDSNDFLDLEVIKDNTSILRDVLVQRYNSKVEDKTIKTDFDYTTRRNHRIRFGGKATWHTFRAAINSYEQASDIDYILIDTIGDWNNTRLRSTELELYIQDELQLSEFIRANIGLRASMLLVNGKHYLVPQPRLMFEFFPEDELTFNVAISRVSQFLHLLTPSSLGLPKDLWVSATERTPPQYSWQFVAGGKKRCKNGYTFSVETYYKYMKNLLIFKETSLDNITSLNWQDKVSVGTGYSYGTEFLLMKEAKKLSGWLGYTLAWSDRKFGADINRGTTFPSRLDRRHNVNLQLLYRLRENWDLSMGFVFATGTAFNLPTQEYEFITPPSGGPPIEIRRNPVIIDEVNEDRMPAYHRLDLTASHRYKLRDAKHTIKFGVYNAYNRRNPLYISLRDKFEDDGTLKTEFIKVSLLPIFPTLRYIIEFK